MSRKSVYINIDETTGNVKALLIDIMLLVDVWARTQKTPIPNQEIVVKMKNKGKSEEQIRHAVDTLIRFGYIRKGYSQSNTICYVQLRRVSEASQV